MSDDAWRRANDLFESLLDLTPAEQQTRLEAECADAPELRREVERRLQADAAAEQAAFLNEPLVDLDALSPSDPKLADAAEASDEWQAPPERLGPYRLLHVIGQGGMGTVYAAERDDEAFERRVAIKVITAGLENEEIIQRMQTERRILAQLEHPNIAQIYDAGATAEGLPYFVMEYVTGQPIDVYCAERDIPLEQRIILMGKVCAAVDYANRNLVVHRDLKPSNILITEDGEPKLLDFGIAKWMEPPEAMGTDGESASGSSQDVAPQDLTVPWRRRLTLNYASPEQIRGEPISTASDVYALGVLLYQLLTGSLPRRLDGLTPWQAEQRLTQEEPPRPSTAAGTSEVSGVFAGEPIFKRLKGDLDAIVLKALRSDVESRYPSAAALAEDLARYSQGFPVKARRGSWRYRTGKWMRRYRLAAGLGTVILLLATAFVVSTVRSAHRLAQGQERLLAEQTKREEVLKVFLGIFEAASPYASEGVDLTVRQAVDRHARHIDEGLQGQPQAQAAVFSTLGWVYLDLGDLEQAHDFHQRALELRRSADAESLDVAESLDGLAASLREQYKLDEADGPSADALQLSRNHQDIEPRHLLRVLNNRVNLFCYREDWQAAAPLSLEALNLGRQVAFDDPEAAKALVQRAQVLRQLGDAEGARALYLEVESTYTRRFGDNHPLLAPLFNNLGRIETEAERYESAVDYFRRADAQYVAAFGDVFYDRIIALTNLGHLLDRLGRQDEAEEALRTALDVAVRSPALEPQHEIRYFGRPATVLAKIWLEQGRCDEVEELLVDKLAKWEERSSGNVVQTSRSLLDQCADLENP